jgi:hypothetical protein
MWSPLIPSAGGGALASIDASWTTSRVVPVEVSICHTAPAFESAARSMSGSPGMALSPLTLAASGSRASARTTGFCALLVKSTLQMTVESGTARRVVVFTTDDATAKTSGRYSAIPVREVAFGKMCTALSVPLMVLGSSVKRLGEATEVRRRSDSDVARTAMFSRKRDVGDW